MSLYQILCDQLCGYNIIVRKKKKNSQTLFTLESVTPYVRSC